MNSIIVLSPFGGMPLRNQRGDPAVDATDNATRHRADIAHRDTTEQPQRWQSA
jgi:hypothetical protein